MSIENVLNTAVDEEKVPFVVGMTANSDGVTSTHAAGNDPVTLRHGGTRPVHPGQNDISPEFLGDFPDARRGLEIQMFAERQLMNIHTGRGDLVPPVFVRSNNGLLVDTRRREGNRQADKKGLCAPDRCAGHDLNEFWKRCHCLAKLRASYFAVS